MNSKLPHVSEAQMVERRSVKPGGVGSSPTGGANNYEFLIINLQFKINCPGGVNGNRTALRMRKLGVRIPPWVPKISKISNPCSSISNQKEMIAEWRLTNADFRNTSDRGPMVGHLPSKEKAAGSNPVCCS